MKKENDTKSTQLQNLKILVGDPDKTVVDEIKQEFNFWHIIAAQTGQEVLKAIEEESPDIVILESVMPNGDGVWVLENLPNFFDRNKIIMTSRYHSDVLIKKAYEQGISYFLLKPMMKDSLQNRILDLASMKKKEFFYRSESSNCNVIHNDIVKPPVICDDVWLESEIAHALKELGVRPHLKGHSFLMIAIKDVYKDETIMASVTEGLYPYIEHKYKEAHHPILTRDNSITIERAMRHAISTGWEHVTQENKQKYFGCYSGNKKPNNSLFIRSVILKLKELKQAI